MNIRPEAYLKTSLKNDWYKLHKIDIILPNKFRNRGTNIGKEKISILVNSGIINFNHHLGFNKDILLI